MVAVEDENELYEAAETFNKLNLTQEEISFIEKHRTIQIAGPKAFPPFHYHDEQGSPAGIGIDYAHLIFDSLGIKAISQPNLPWPEVMKRARERKIDVIPLIAVSEDRKSFLNFSDAYLSFPFVIIARNDAPFIGGLEDLYNKKITCIKKVVTCVWLNRDLKEFVPVLVDTPLQGLEAVAYGEADAHIDNLAAATFMIQKNGLTSLKVAAPTKYGYYKLHFSIRKDWVVLQSIINKALAAITPEQHAAIRSRWLSIRYEHGIRFDDVVRWLTLVSGVAMIIIIFTLVWNTRLKKEITEKEKATKALKDSQETFAAIFHHSPASITINKEDTGEYVSVNDAAVEFTGFSQEELIGETAANLKLWENIQERNEFISEIKEEGSIKNREFMLKDKNGAQKHGLISGVSVNIHNEPHTMFVTMDISEHKSSEKKLKDAEIEQKRLIRKLLDALDNIKTLKGMLPICAHCKKIRDDSGYWKQIEAYIEEHSDALFSHGICPGCAKDLYGNEPWYHKSNQASS